MELNNLAYTKGARAAHYRKGRGVGSGNGKNAGTGNKGQNSRRQGEVAPGFEGGQNPLWRRLPKYGLNHTKHVKYAIINLDVLNRFEEGSTVDMTLLVEKGIVKDELNGLKVLGNGELTKKINVKAAKVSASAKEAIEKLGGTIEVK